MVQTDGRNRLRVKPTMMYYPKFPSLGCLGRGVFRNLQGYFLAIILLLTFSTTSYSQSSCPNLDFSYGDFTNWQAYRGVCGGNYYLISPTTPISGRHTLMNAVQLQSSGQFYDETCNSIQKVPYAFNYAAKLFSYGTEVHALEYIMTIDSSNALLIVYFAWVVDTTDHHGPFGEPPKFILQIRDSLGTPINLACSDITPTANLQLSNLACNPFESGRNWTAIGYNLEAFIGQTVKVWFETRGCTMSSHNCHAYVVANCSPVVQREIFLCKGYNVAPVSAPEYFETYTWTRSSDPNWSLLAPTRRITVQNLLDNEILTCTTVNFLGCVAEIKYIIKERSINADFLYGAIDSNGHVPLAEKGWESWYDTCSRTATFVDFSIVKNTVKDSILWEIINPYGMIIATSTDSLFTYTFPEPTINQSVTYQVRLIAFESICNITDTTSQNITMYHFAPEVTNYAVSICVGAVYSDNNFKDLTQAGTYYDTLQKVNGCDSIVELTLSYYPTIPITNYSTIICIGDVYSDNNFKNLTQAETYYDTLQNINGCDSIIELTLSYYPNVAVTNYSDIICYGEVYNDVNFSNLTQAGTYCNTLQNINRCDSVVCLTLSVNPTTEIDSIIANAEFLCEGDELKIEVIALGKNIVYQWYQDGNLLFGEQNRNFTVSAVNQSHSGEYHVEVFGDCGDVKSSSVVIDASGVNMLIEKWNDVILVDNSKNEYKGYQWYKNGSKIPNATNQFYQELGGLNACYSVELTLISGKKVFSCELCLSKVSKQMAVYPNPTMRGNPITIILTKENQTSEDLFNVELYTIDGKLLKMQLQSYGKTDIETSSLPAGIYILKLTTNDGQIYNEKIVVY